MRLIARAARVLSLAIVTTVAIIWGTAAQVRVPPGTTWYWQLDGKTKTGQAAQLYDIDMEAATPMLISELKGTGRVVICYISAGTYESGRSDVTQFPKSTIGKKVKGWPEHYVDIRDPTVRKVMQARIDAAKAKGCDGFEPDVLDAFSNPSGLPINVADEVSYIRWLASEGHSRGLLVALKNAPEIVTQVVDAVDFAIAEECFKYRECDAYSSFIKAGKAVLSAEYSAFSATKCAQAAKLGLSLVFYGLDLDGRQYKPCPALTAADLAAAAATGSID